MKRTIQGPALGSFTPYPAPLMAWLSPQQLWWQQQLYLRAYAVALGSELRIARPFVARDLTPAERN
jgi:hypothetical protein